MLTSGKAMPDSSFKFDAAQGHPDANLAFTLPLPEPFSYDEVLLYLTRSPHEILHFVEDRAIHKAIELDGKLVWFVIREHGELSNVLQIELLGGFTTADTAAGYAIASYVKEWLDLETDLTSFYQVAEQDPLLGPLARDYRGLRIVGAPGLFEALCWAVLGQQVNLSFAYTMKRRFIETYGRRVERDGRALWLFPQPEAVLGSSVEALKQLQFTGKKAEYILGLAQLMADGALSKEALLAEPDFRAAEKQLLAIRGIGPWTAHYVMMRCLRDRAAFPVGDAGLHNALKLLLGRSEKPTEEEIRQLFAPWKGWEAYGVFYFWRSLTQA